VQTVLARLAERGVLARERQGRGYMYATRVSEDDYLAHAISRTLASASDDARHSALARLIGELDADELSKVQRLARKARRGREA
jgi:predicted transcriptional regulator